MTVQTLWRPYANSSALRICGRATVLDTANSCADILAASLSTIGLLGNLARLYRSAFGSSAMGLPAPFHNSRGPAVPACLPVARFISRRDHGRQAEPSTSSPNGSAPRGRESSVEEGSTRIVVDRSGSWRAGWSGNRLGWSLATKVALGG